MAMTRSNPLPAEMLYRGADTALGSVAFADQPQFNNQTQLSASQASDFTGQLNTALQGTETEGGEIEQDPRAVLAALEGIQQAASPDQFKNIDQLITSRTDPALDILQQGSSEQIRLLREGARAGIDPLASQIDLRGLDEQQSLLGLRGQDAQRSAISGIPVSQFDQELQRRQRQQLMRGANAAGEAGGGATIAAGAQLAGAQQSDIIQRRLAQLEPLVKTARGLSSSVSQLSEQGRVGEAQLQSALGTQMGNIRMGVVAPQIQSRLAGAELSGLQGIASAQRKGQTAQQLAGLAGIFAQSYGGGS